MTDPFKELVIDAICGAGFPSMESASRWQAQGFATFTGNQHNPTWVWNRDEIGRLSVAGLQEIYQSIKERQMLQRQALNVIAKAAAPAAVAARPE